MADMLVKLYDLPAAAPAFAEVTRRGLEMRRAWPTDKRVVADWVEHHFNDGLAAHCEATFEQRPVTCFIAVKTNQTNTPSANPYDLPTELLLGFACYDAAFRGMFGPIGVREDMRGAGVGRALLLASLHAMAAERYAYAVIGWAGSTDFYAKTVGATIITGSEPGIYRGQLKDTI
jgi:GNAT superfamily N-acetyltransferase